MKMIFGERGVKASGGIKTLDFAIELAKFGATRIGTSSSLGLIN
jgi:deoxyribose-phosphate aldolase